MITIQYVSPVYSKVNKEGITTLSKVLFHKQTFWRQTRFKKVQSEYNKLLIGKDGIFLSGFLPKVFDYLKSKNESYGIIGYPNSDIHNCAELHQIKGVTLRSEQTQAIEQAMVNKRGVIHYPTGSGKTIIFLSILNNLQKPNCLILLHRTDLLYQTYQEANRIFPNEVGMIGNGVRDPNRITIATIQSMSRTPPSDFHDKQDVVIVDECHHISSFSGDYHKVLTQIPAPLRFGFTATLPHTEEGKMALEGLIGPVISEKKVQEVPNLAKPIIKFRKLPYSASVHAYRSWKDVYKMGVVFNSRRHRMVLEDAEKLIKEGRTVLILIVEIQHGVNLKEMLDTRFPHLNIPFIWGNTSAEERHLVKNMLESKKVDGVIANVIWREGIDIPSLGAVINAAGGKSEIMTLQALGRGLRKAPGKDDVIIIDYFDPSNTYLIEHFGYRLTCYYENGWL